MLRSRFISVFITLIALLTFQCKQNKEATTTSNDPLLMKWEGGDYNGIPPFDKVRVSDFKNIFDKTSAIYRDEVNKIAAQKDAPTFDNTMLALESSGILYKQFQSVYYIWSSNLNDAEMSAVQEILEPRMAAFNDEINQNNALYQRIEALYNAPGKSDMTPEQQRLI